MDRAIEGGRDKAAEQGMRLVGAALEFGVELRADEPAVSYTHLTLPTKRIV